MISVILPTYKEPIGYIEKAVDSILLQSYNNLELIIVVDAPERKDVIERLDRKSADDNRIKLVVNKKNSGLVKSLNRAIKSAQGEYIARMDADDISTRSRLKKQLDFLIDNDLDLVGGAIMDMAPDDTLLYEDITYYPSNPKLSKKMLKYNTAAAHPTWLARKELFEKNKYKDFPACEDYEFLTRIALDGKKIASIPEVVLYYRQNEASISSNKKGLQKTSLYYIRKRYRKGKKTDIREFGNYIKSQNGCRDLKKTEEYYQKRETIKRTKKLKKALLIMTLLSDRVTRDHLYSSIASKILRKRRAFREAKC